MSFVRGMKIVASLAVVSAALVSCGPKGADTAAVMSDGSIVGGTATTEDVFKSVVGISRGGQLVCTGNLVAQKKILTAAHCVAPFQYTSQARAQAMAIKVNQQLSTMVENGEQFNALSKEDKRRLLKASVKEVVERGFGDVKIYLGNGKVGERAQTGTDLISKVGISDEAMAYVQAQFLKMTEYTTPEDAAVTYSASLDLATVSLKEAVTDRAPTPVIDSNEHADHVTNGMDATLVGFGLKIDRRFVTASASNLEDLTEKIERETDEEAKKELMSQFLEEFQFYNQAVQMSNSSGDKQKVTVKLENYTHIQMTFKRKGQDLQGACQGDSGGPAFVQLPDGSYRQVGVIVTVDYCGNNTNAVPVID